MNFENELKNLLEKHINVIKNPDRDKLIKDVVENNEALVSKNGALSTRTPPESTGRSPKDTYIVKREKIEKNIDWDSPSNIPIDPETFDMLLKDALDVLGKKKSIYVTDRSIGADVSYAVTVKTVTDRALISLFTCTMFRNIPKGIEKSIFANRDFTIIVLPYNKVNADKYTGKLRVSEKTKKTSDMAIVMDFDKNIGLVYGSAYCGTVKKLMFTCMNYILPEKGILPLHCSANEGEKGDIALFLGLSGTGKTTLSADPNRALLGDDEHGWSNNGIANFEYGCYAKLINLDPKKEPEIYNSIMHKADYRKHGVIVENAMMYPDGRFDFSDQRLTPNSRGSYLLDYLSNVKKSSMGGHPKTIIFLTADANGVLPPISKLNENQAMLWFLMGYTSKLAGTETGIVEPKSTFSRFFGEPFMPRNPEDYAKLLGEKIKKYKTNVYLIDTGWEGGPYGVGKRIDIDVTRAIVRAALSGKLENVEYRKDENFHLMVPKTCSGIPSNILNPKNDWKDKEAYDKRAKKIAKDFANYFDREYSDNNIGEQIKKECPGK